MKKLCAKLSAAALLAAVICSCGGSTKPSESQKPSTETAVVLGAFNKDSAYQYIADQVNFGPRIPGTEAHEKCAAYLVGKLRNFGADTVIEQKTTVTAYNGDQLPINNIFARFNRDAINRVLLVAHWDTRPWANRENNDEKRRMPVPGANDGGSGVGVILELARNFSLKSPDCGVDILFTDAEDYGDSRAFTTTDNTWCLGTQYWVDNLPYSHVNRPAYGILLDMVGGRGARFHRELMSHEKAKAATVKVWAEAQNLGLGDIFVNKVGGAVVDDHIFLTEAGIPTTDIIEHMNDITGNFPAYWHTLDDNMQQISKHTLDAVGKTVLNVIYKENAQ